MIEPDQVPKTLQQAVIYFADLDRCRDFMRAVKWPDGKPTCPACKSENVGDIATRKMLKCNDCDYQFSERNGTIFADSPVTLGQWFAALWSEANDLKISSATLGEAIGVTQKTAWRMQTRLRAARHLAHSVVQ